MNFYGIKQSAAVIEWEPTSAADAQQLSQEWHFKPTDSGHWPHQTHQLQAPDAVCDTPSSCCAQCHLPYTPHQSLVLLSWLSGLHTISLTLKDCYDRWKPKSWTKWTQQTFWRDEPQTKVMTSVCIYQKTGKVVVIYWKCGTWGWCIWHRRRCG